MDREEFNEEFVIYNLACTAKLNKICEKNKQLNWCLAKKTFSKEVYILRFRGTWEELASTIRTICDAGLTFYRNMHFYEHNKTRLLIMDIDGKDGVETGISTDAANSLLKKGKEHGVLVIPSSRCNYDPEHPDPNAIKKYHVFVYTAVYNCTPKEIAAKSDKFIMSIEGDDIETAKDKFEWDKAALKNWQYFFSKSNLSVEQIDADPNINVRYRDERGCD